MRVVHDYRVAMLAPTNGCALAIGNFDGLHQGHREILARTVALAQTHTPHLHTVVFTFEPHPTRFLAPERASPLITGLDRRLELLGSTGIDTAIVQAFDRDFSQQTPREFAQSVLAGLRARHVFVGQDFRFGRGREGDGAMLATLGKDLGFETTIVAPVLDNSELISSSRVRKALAEGDLERVHRMLGRPFDLDGLVVHGDHRGRTIGVPTANLRTRVEALPKDGVYAVRAHVRGEGEPVVWNGVMNIGMRPTFAAGRSIEVHMLDVPADLDVYGRTLRVECVARLRDEQKFNGLDALREQIARDIARARTLLGLENG